VSFEALSPPYRGAVQDAQVNLPGPHAGRLPAVPELLPEVITLTELKARVTFSEPHFSQTGFAPSEYAVMDIRTSNRTAQSWQA
jgi:hypothetical protein